MFKEIKNQTNECDILGTELKLSKRECNFVKKSVSRYSKAKSCCAKWGNALHRIKNAFLTIICCSDKQRCKRLLKNRYVYVRFEEFGRLNGKNKQVKGVRKQVYKAVEQNIASSEQMFRFLVNAEEGRENTQLKQVLRESDQRLEHQLRTYPYPWAQPFKTHKDAVEEYWRQQAQK